MDICTHAGQVAVDKAFKVGSFFSPARAGERVRAIRTSDRTNIFIVRTLPFDNLITRNGIPKCRDAFMLQDLRVLDKPGLLRIFAYGICT